MSSTIDNNPPPSSSKRRWILPGTSLSEYSNYQESIRSSSLIPLNERHSTLGTYEYIQDLIDRDSSNTSDIISLPLSPSSDKSIWLLEHIRSLLQEINNLILFLPCNKQSCLVMLATQDWEFLCATHPGKPKKCSAIDYILHTLTGFQSLINNIDLFPNRIKINPRSAQYFSSIVRRLYRVFAHAYYHHKEEFLLYENNNHLYERFILLSINFQLMDLKTMIPVVPISTPHLIIIDDKTPIEMPIISQRLKESGGIGGGNMGTGKDNISATMIPAAMIMGGGKKGGKGSNSSDP